MVYVTGDTHTSVDRAIQFCQENNLGENDIVVILGDSCLNYLPRQSSEEVFRKSQLNDLGVKFFILHGNHDKNPKNMKNMYEKRKAFGSSVFVEAQFENLLFARDGKCYELEGSKCLVLGGAASIDKDRRIVHKEPWYPDEQMDKKDKKKARKTLEKLNWKVDYVFSHTCPKKAIPLEALVEGVNEYKVDHSTEKFLDKIENKLKYRTWYCGHWHINKAAGRIHFLFDDFEVLGK